MNTKLRNLIIDLDLSEDLGLTEDEVVHAEKRLTMVKASFGSSSEWMSALDSVIMAYRNDALRAGVRDAEDADREHNPGCLICSKPMEPVTLMGGVPAFYCQAHRVVIPTVKE